MTPKRKLFTYSKYCSVCEETISRAQNFKKHLETTKHKNNEIDRTINKHYYEKEVDSEMYSLVPHTKKRSLDEFQEFTEATQYLKKLKENNTDPKDIQ